MDKIAKLAEDLKKLAAMPPWLKKKIEDRKAKEGKGGKKDDKKDKKANPFKK